MQNHRILFVSNIALIYFLQTEKAHYLHSKFLFSLEIVISFCIDFRVKLYFNFPYNLFEYTNTMQKIENTQFYSLQKSECLQENSSEFNWK